MKKVLEWYAFRFDTSKKKLEFINVLDGTETILRDKLKKCSKDNYEPIVDYVSFKEWLKVELMYRYWCKAEHEVVICDLFDVRNENGEKHDIWWQLEPNLDRIAEYINTTMELGL